MSFSSPPRLKGASEGFFTPELVGSTRAHLVEPSLTTTKKRLLDVLPKDIDEIEHVQIKIGKKKRVSGALKDDESTTDGHAVVFVVGAEVISDNGSVEKEKVAGDCHQIVMDNAEYGLCLEIIKPDGIRQGYNRLNREWLISELLAHIMPEDKLSKLDLYDQKNKAVRRDNVVSNLDHSITYCIRASKIAGSN